MKKDFFGYVRVSTTRQGVEGVSLQAQRDAILAYAAKHGFNVSHWFEEQQTAAKRGRPVLGRMLKDLRAGRASGVIMHKIDRGARNLRDWADLAELMDSGIVVHFANDGLDLSSRGGRLSADIQAVVAADFIRNLRDETKKGLKGRLNQGLYPWAAPLGYLDNGRGRPKTICPTRGPLVRQAFQLYATGDYALEMLVNEMRRRGLDGRTGQPITQSVLSAVLNNSFYTGAIQKMGETFAGKHEPLISMALFSQVQAKLQDRSAAKVQRHDFTYRRMLQCARCGKNLIGERHRTSVNVYYRCQTKGCQGTIVREGDVDLAAKRVFSHLVFETGDADTIRQQVDLLRRDWNVQREERRASLAARLAQVEQRLARLTDLFLDGAFDGEVYKMKQSELRREQAELRELLASVPLDGDAIADQACQLLTIGLGAYYSLDYATGFEKRQLFKAVFSNRVVDVKNVVLEPRSPYDFIFGNPKSGSGSPLRRGPRTFGQIAKLFWDFGIKRLINGVILEEAA